MLQKHSPPKVFIHPFYSLHNEHLPNLSLDAIDSIHSVHSVYIFYFKQCGIFYEQVPSIFLNKSSLNYGSTQYFCFSQNGFGQD